MTRETVLREIARLDAISRTRALDDRETYQLDRFITTERSYDRARANRPSCSEAEEKPPARRRLHAIVDRLDATITQMARDHLSIRAIYLVPPDLDELVGSGAVDGYRNAAFRGYPVHQGKASLVYSTQGIARSVRRTAA